MTGTFSVIRPADRIFDDRPQRNKALVLKAMTSLFQRHDASAVERLYAPDFRFLAELAKAAIAPRHAGRSNLSFRIHALSSVSLRAA
ncbi:hypothetical protein [Mesorhizobium sp. M7A.F.Ca.US.008.03.1.1]|uniref:hypothetical protein n=1 Tax=Mesorhizobium sp. M7A.F.Ca.US.008.03.1.1 TaxID=2496742 RepID=UPI000FCA8BAD|nr:hypothetical protein [Mesorhizobium sp. M7A.F.Ca.US.008.03.1.1]RUW58114.1 hypothetical protein EOA16_29150 [Mesorhizobium sp. M7A.F.Ca.US.008.03.1.1]